MTGRENLRNGAERLYDEPTLRDSPAFDLLKLIGLKALKWIGMGIDSVTRWIPLPSYPTGEGKEKPNTNAYKSQIPLGSDGASALGNYPVAEKMLMAKYAHYLRGCNSRTVVRISPRYMEEVRT